MTLKIIALRPGGALGNPSKILRFLQNPQETQRQVQSCKFVVFRNEQKDLALAIGYDIHPLIARQAAPHVGEGYKIDSGGKITYHPVGVDQWRAVLGGWSTTYEGPFTPELLYHAAEIAKILGMQTIFRWEVEEFPQTGNRSYVTDPSLDLPL